MKRVLSLFLAVLMVFTLVACGQSEPTTVPDDNGTDSSTQEPGASVSELMNKGEKLVVWTFTDELKGMIENHYLVDNPDLGYEVEVVVVPNDNYQTKLDPALASGKAAPDVFALEAAFVKKYVESPYTKDLTTLGFSNEQTETLPYVMDVARDPNGVLKGLSWQGTPGAFFYRRSIAEKYLGVSEPADVQALVSDFDKFYEVTKKMYTDSDGKVSAIGSLGDLVQVFMAAREQAWVEGDNFIIDPQVVALFEMAKKLEQEGLTNKADQWTESWFAGMSGDSVFGYFLPTWGLHYVLKPNATNAETGVSTSGDWGMIQGPAGYFWGGTWVAVREGTEMEKAAEHLVNYLTLDENFLTAWAEETGDFLSYQPVVNAIKDTYSEPFLAGQNHYAEFAQMALAIDASTLTGYDQDIQKIMNEQMTAYSKGEKDLDAAMADFKSAVKNSFPDLNVD